MAPGQQSINQRVSNHPFYKNNVRKDKAWHLIAVVLGVEGEYIRLGLSRDLVISREYGWLARQRCAAVTRPVESPGHSWPISVFFLISS